MDYSSYKQLEFRRKFFKLFGAEITVFDGTTDATIGFIKMKAWKLKEDIRLFRDSTQQQEIMAIHARNIIDFGATYDVIDSASGTALFSLRRSGIRSTFLRGHWVIQDSCETPLAEILETSSALALARRYFGIIPYVGGILDLAFAFVPQTFAIYHAADGSKQLAATITHRKNPFIVKMQLDRSAAQVEIDARISIAATALLSVIDATKS